MDEKTNELYDALDKKANINISEESMKKLNKHVFRPKLRDINAPRKAPAESEAEIISINEKVPDEVRWLEPGSFFDGYA